MLAEVTGLGAAEGTDEGEEGEDTPATPVLRSDSFAAPPQISFAERERETEGYQHLVACNVCYYSLLPAQWLLHSLQVRKLIDAPFLTELSQ